METQINSLWPEDIGTNIDQSNPVTILKQQAALLGQRTKNIVEAQVSTSTFADHFIHSFNLVAPAIGYKYLLFRVQHGPEIYPIALIYDTTDSTSLTIRMTASSETEFLDLLKEVFSSARTRKVIETLLAMSQK